MDNRMQWILHFEENSKNKKSKIYFTDYEICSEVRIPGIFEYGNGSLLCGLTSEKNQLGLYTYTVRLKHTQKEYKFDRNKYSRNGYYFKGGIMGELITIFSFYFQVRFFIKSTSFGELTTNSLQTKEEKQLRYIKPNISANYDMFTNQGRNWALGEGLKRFLDNIKEIDSEYHQQLINSFHWYLEAIKEIGLDNELFYLKMISCVEALIPVIVLESDSLERKFGSIFNKKMFTNAEKNEITNWLSNRKIKHRYIKFIEIYSKDFFKRGNRKAGHCYIRKSELKDYLNRIYNARSSYIHTGEPMYISFDMNVESDSTDNKCQFWDLCPSGGMMIDRKEMSGRNKLPRARWFERIINHSIKNYIEQILMHAR